MCPGVAWTGLAGGGIDEPPPAARPIQAPIKRWGLPMDVANAALFFASSESSFVTGTALAVDGGYAIGPSGDAFAPPPREEARMPHGDASSSKTSLTGTPLENPAFLTAPQAIFPGLRARARSPWATGEYSSRAAPTWRPCSRTPRCSLRA